MKVLILTEAGKSIGFGHLTRCIGLYQGFEEKGFEVEIVVNADSSVDFLLKGIKYKKFDWLRKRKDAFKSLRKVDIVIIDSYLADLDFYKKVSEIVKIPVYIDDYKRLDYPKGIVINPSIYGDRLNYPKKEGVRYLLGKQYIILRKEFWNVPKKKINKHIKNVLITFGGTNQQDLAKTIARYLEDKFSFNISIVDPNKNFTAKDMLKLMLEADICISGGGQTTYELARVGVPTIGICFAENQLNNLKYGEKEGYLIFAGWFDEKDLLLKKIENIIKSLNFDMRFKMIEKSQKLISGSGQKNIIMEIEKLVFSQTFTKKSYKI
jgi:spore coat polysaccharide biosynthesis predicted glycosyltransferase SpsG